MRLQRLRLMAYGRFTDQELDFSAGNQGLHIVLGRNEAGKTTTLRALQSLFYGFPKAAEDAFHHPAPKIRLGACIRDGHGRALDFVRRRGQSGGRISDAATDAVIGQELIDAMLGGVDRSTFLNLYGLSHNQLVEGGGEILLGKGRAGEALLMAGAGMRSLVTLRAAWEDRVAQLYKPHGNATAPELNRLLLQYREAMAAMRDSQLQTETWRAMDAGLQETMRLQKLAGEEVMRLATESERLRRIHAALEHIAIRREALLALDARRDIPWLEADFSRKWRMDTQLISTADARLDALASEQAETRRRLDGALVDGSLLEAGSRIEMLHLQSPTLARDEERRGVIVSRRAVIAAQLAALAFALDCGEDDVIPRVKPAARKRAAALANKAETLREHRVHTARRLVESWTEKERLAAALAAMGPPPDLTLLDTAIAAAQRDGRLEEEHSIHRQTLERNGVLIAEGLGRLPLWSGTIEALITLPTPPAAAIRAARKEREEQLQEMKSAAAMLETAREELAAARMDMETLRASEGLASEEELVRVRVMRDAWWRLARSRWEKGVGPEEMGGPLPESPPEGARNLADAYEYSVSAVDITADRVRMSSRNAARFVNAKERHDRCQGVVQRLEEAHAVLTLRREASEAQWRSLWDETGVVPLPPGVMEEWLEQCEDLRRIAGERAAAAARLAEVERSLADTAALLDDAIRRAGTPPLDDAPPLAVRLDHAVIARDALRQKASERQALERDLARVALEESPAREREDAEARIALEEWRNRWEAACLEVGFAPGVEPGDAVALLEQREEFCGLRDERTALDAELEGIALRKSEFERAVSQFTAGTAPELAGKPPLDAAAILWERLQSARANDTLAVELRQRLDACEDQSREYAREAEEARARLADHCRMAGVERPDMLEEVEQEAEHKEKARAALETADKELLRLSGGLPLDEFIAQVEAEDPDTLPARMESIETELAAANAEKDRLHGATGESRGSIAALDISGRAATAAGEAQQTIAAMRDAVERYINARACLFALDRAMERYRLRHQSPMLNRAGDLFRDITSGAFAGLALECTPKGESLIMGVRPGADDRVPVEAMSEGTADQLFLALRLAALWEHPSPGDVPPLIVDDILVNFDDHRSLATLRALGDLSARMQIIFFTHHAHIVSLAREGLPGDMIYFHELG